MSSVLGRVLGWLEAVSYICRAFCSLKRYPCLLGAVDVLLLEEDVHANFLEHTNILENVSGIPCKSADGLGNNHVDFAAPTLLYHLVKLVTLFGACPRKSPVRKDAHKGPFWLASDFLGVVPDLHVIAV